MYRIYTILAFVLSLAFNLYLNYFKNADYKEELKLYWGDKCFHIHHWVFFTLFIGLLYLGRHMPNYGYVIFIAIFLGSIVEDFFYKDVFIFRENCEMCDKLGDNWVME